MNSDLMGRRDWIIALSFLECILLLFFSLLIFSGIGIGAGYYLGTQCNNEIEILALAEDLSVAQQGQIESMQMGLDILQARVGKYEEFLLGVGLEPTLPPVIESPDREEKFRRKKNANRNHRTAPRNAPR